MKASSLRRSFLFALLVHVPSMVSGAVVIDNLAAGSQGFAASISGPSAVGFLGFPFANREIAFSFTSGPDLVRLTQFDFMVNITSNASPIQVMLSTGSGVPGGNDPVLVGSAAPASTSPTTQTLTIVPAGSVFLQPGTLYWVHLTVPTGSGNYSFNNSNAPMVDPSWSLGNTWSRSSSTGAWSEITSGPQARVRLTVVPEPSALLLGSCGLLLALRRRR
jgi:hypothetical protein